LFIRESVKQAQGTQRGCASTAEVKVTHDAGFSPCGGWVLP